MRRYKGRDRLELSSLRHQQRNWSSGSKTSREAPAQKPSSSSPFRQLLSAVWKAFKMFHHLCLVIALTGAAVAEICTVTGPTVIDFQGFLNNVVDRCGHSLMSDTDAGFEVLAHFLERRRKDVSFVDSVTLSVAGSGDIVLQQGGRVLVNGAVVSLSKTVKNFFGIDIYEDETGVTAEHITSEYTVTVFFDGTTAQISTDEPHNSTLTGLCVDSRDISSPASCKLHTEAPDSSVNCAAVIKRCNMLTKHSFASCNADVDPTPYMQACQATMCRYPLQDALITQFLWAYARACGLNGHSELGDWWTKAECSPPKAYCRDVICTDHEFCGWKFSGEPACLCRAEFASKYKESNTLGEPTVCKHSSASLTLAKCLMEERGIDYKDLHLNDQRCRGKLDRKSNMVTFNFNTEKLCGAEITYNNNEINYTNAIMSQNTTDLIVRHDQVFIEFSCFNSQPELKSVSFRVKDNSYVSTVKSGEWTYNVSMTPYIDEKCSKAVATDTDVKLDQKVWVELRTKGLDAKRIAVVTKSCWATSEPNPDSTPRYDLIVDGCANPDDGTVHVKGNGVGTSNLFSFNMFEFTRHPDNVYLHCQLQLCIIKDNICVPTVSMVTLTERQAADLHADLSPDAERREGTSSFPAAVMTHSWN
ncbi:alpha-tectorin-like [Nematolebias whitei]|uniref:alpha-tectorin-like n=1 Tax=Nematolebias whitei TaxID=451745 RepID=UPI001896D3B8|nr:alpha-tectorin-like [Nematolebias whitei]